MRNKIIASVLVFSLIGVDIAVAADNITKKSFWEDATFTNFTGPGEATDPNTGTKYYSGGSYHVKFKTSGEYEPWLQVSGPEIKAGCRGVSLNLGFGSLINFEQLSKQLQEAGASIAWGVLIGLAYSLPALKQVFDTIQDWAAKIQAMLANSCNFGKAIGQHIADKSGLKDNLGTGVESWISENVDSHLKEWVSGPLDTADQWINKTIKDGTTTQEDNKELAAGQISKYINDKGSGVVSAYLTSLVRNGIETGVDFPNPPSGATGFSVKKVSLRESGLSSSSKLVTLLILSMVQDNLINESAGATLVSLSNASESGNRNAIADNVDALKEMTLTQGKWTSSLSSQEILKFFLDGSDSTFATSPFLPSLYLTVEKSKNGRYDRSIYLGTSYNSNIGLSGTDRLGIGSWEGIRNESAFVVANTANSYFKKISGREDYTHYTTDLPLLLPQKYEEIKNIIVALKISDGEAIVENGAIKVSTNRNLEAYFNEIAKLNAEKSLEMIIGSISTEIRKAAVAASKRNEGDGQEQEKADSFGSEKLAAVKEDLDKKLTEIRAEIASGKKESMQAIQNILNQLKLEDAKKQIVQGRNK